MPLRSLLLQSLNTLETTLIKSLNNKHVALAWLVLITISGIMHLRAFKSDLMSVHVWRQTQTQTNIVNFYQDDFNIFNPQINNRGIDDDGIYRMEFPLMQWSFAAVYKVFGNHIIISRLLTFIMGLFTLWAFYKLLSLFLKSKFLALCGVWALNFSPLFFYYTVNPLPDNMALCFSVWALYFFFSYQQSRNLKTFVWYVAFLALATLCKLPFILFGALLIGNLIRERKPFTTHNISIVGITGIAMILPIAWYAWVIFGADSSWHGNGILLGIFEENGSILNTIIDVGSHWLLIVIPEMFVNYAAAPLLIIGIVLAIKNRIFKLAYFLPLLCTLAVIIAYFLFEIQQINVHHDYYLFPLLPLLFLVIAYGIKWMMNNEKKWLRYMCIVILLALPITTYLRMESRWNIDKPGLNADLIHHKDALQNAIPQDAMCIVGIDNTPYVFLYYINKKGYVIGEMTNSTERFSAMVENGATYFYSDNRELENNSNVQAFIDNQVAEFGSIKVFKLKEG